MGVGDFVFRCELWSVCGTEAGTKSLPSKLLESICDQMKSRCLSSIFFHLAKSLGIRLAYGLQVLSN